MKTFEDLELDMGRRKGRDLFLLKKPSYSCVHVVGQLWKPVLMLGQMDGWVGLARLRLDSMYLLPPSRNPHC